MLSDVVEEWKAAVRERLREEASGRAGRPVLELRFSREFFPVAFLLGSLGGVRGALTTPLLLTTTFVAQELPRALLSRRFGRSSRILVSLLGSDTEISGAPIGGPSRIALAVIGSIANLGIAGAAMGFVFSGVREPWAALLRTGALFHGVWGLAELLPIPPFRSHVLIASLRARIRLPIALTTALVLAGVSSRLAEAAVTRAALPILAIILGASVRGILDAYRDLWDESARVDQLAGEARARMLQEPALAAQLAQRALPFARSPRYKAQIAQTLAWAAIGKNDPVLAHAGLMNMQKEQLNVHLIAAYLVCCNRRDEALELLQHARAMGQRTPETTKLLVDLLFCCGKIADAMAVARSDQALLSPDDLKAVELAAASQPTAAASR